MSDATRTLLTRRLAAAVTRQQRPTNEPTSSKIGTITATASGTPSTVGVQIGASPTAVQLRYLAGTTLAVGDRVLIRVRGGDMVVEGKLA